MKPADLPALAFLMAVADSKKLDARQLAAVGMDVVSVKLKATAAAEKAWEAKKAPGKKA